MAKITKIQLIDDIDGSQADESIEFSVRGKGYRIDLSEANAKDFDSAFAGFIESATLLGKVVIGGRTHIQAVGRAAASLEDRERNQAVRDWARGRGTKVADRGRIPAQVLDAYNQEHGS